MTRSSPRVRLVRQSETNSCYRKARPGAGKVSHNPPLAYVGEGLGHPTVLPALGPSYFSFASMTSDLHFRGFLRKGVTYRTRQIHIVKKIHKSLSPSSTHLLLSRP
jgi:hypothetical protein